jgi:DNA-binding transcriptional LysR family regulator
MRFSLRALRYMVETADAGSVTEAAKRLNVSQPSISAALSQIEAELGIQVFVRHLAKGVMLYSAGQRLVNDAQLLLNHARDFAQSAQSLGNTLHGEIVVSSFPTLATASCPDCSPAFANGSPASRSSSRKATSRKSLTP